MKWHSGVLPLLAIAVWLDHGSPIVHRATIRTPARAERVSSNDNRAAAGTVRGGEVSVSLEVREGEWHPDRDTDPGIVVRAFGEAGKALQVPGPLIRVRAGTTVTITLRNTLADAPLLVHGLTAAGQSVASVDTVQLKPAESRTVRFVARAPGNYFYWGTTSGSTSLDRQGIDSQLGGAIIVDGPETSPSMRDRVLVIGLWTTRPRNGVVAREDLLRFVINGRAWPNTERLDYTVGDSVRLRIINSSSAPHPMHLHGFYFDVESRGNGQQDQRFDRAVSRRMVVTERAGPGNTFSLLWVPERPGNWLFHCHDNFHTLRNRALDGTPMVAEQHQHVTNHATDMMGGLVMGIAVRPRAGARPVATTNATTAATRTLRLTARVDTGGTSAEPAYGYVLQDGAKRSPAATAMLPGPTIVLTRNEPVRIRVVNELPEATAVHWHGIELDSYYDGVADFAGHPGRIAPAIARRDSFDVYFTPPRSGTFMYHPHADEVRQQQAGLSGAIVVLDSGATFDAEHDVVLLLSVPRREADGSTVLLNGTNAPSVREWRVGERYRLRVVNIHTARPSMTLRLHRDTTLMTWKAIAKDGMDLPVDQATTRPSAQLLGNGEAYDFEFSPTAPGDYSVTVVAATGALLVRMPIRVR